MEYRQNDWSILGFGCMRFPKKGGSVDMKETERELAYAIAHGVNYFDTAYIYRGNEKVLGELVAKNHWRAQIQIATKMPHYLIHSIDELEKLFCEQLKRLQTDYVDNYLMHMLPDVHIWKKLVRMGILDWINEKKENGQIRRIGFSYHGNSQNFIALLDAYDWEFCQVQYNYMDIHNQAGAEGVAYAAKKGIPVIIMEPLRGGRLVNGLPKKAKDLFAAAEPKRSPAEWGLRWLWNQPEVTTVLSGMNSIEMIRENCRIASETREGAFTEEETAFVNELKDAINHSMKVGCTGCGYCMPCPKNVDIPGTFSFYNLIYSENKKTARKGYMQCTIFRQTPTSASQCVGCGKCEQHCPQGIPIREELKHASKELENVTYKLAGKAIRLFKLW